MESARALVIGEALVDVVHRADGSVAELPGGSAANVAVALSRLERPVLFATAFADDAYGSVLAEHLGANGVALAADPGAVEHTSSAMATIAEDGSASYVFDLDWRLNRLELPGGDDIDDVELAVVHACSLGAVLQPGADQVFELVDRLRAGATVSYDVNARPVITGTGPEVVALVERMAGVSDIVKASDEDLAALYPGLSQLEAATHLRGLGPAAVVVTRGAEGALCVSGDGFVEAASVTVEVADTIGAGDTFGAAVLDALWTRGLLGGEHRSRLRALAEQEWREVLDHAARAAAVTVSRPGADPPHRHELR